MRLAIIPARGGSKRIPEKNIRSFLGKPIIAYSIEAAIESGVFDQVIVSTDSQKIADIAISFGADVPFIRSSKNSDDHSTLADVAKEVLGQFQEKDNHIETFCIILPTAPFLTSQIIRESLDRMLNYKLDGIFTAVKFSYPIQRAIRVDQGTGRVQMVDSQYINSRSQDLEPRFHDAGQMYMIDVATFQDENTFFVSNGGILELSELQVQDIDSEIDWVVAEMKFVFSRERGLL